MSKSVSDVPFQYVVFPNPIGWETVIGGAIGGFLAAGGGIGVKFESTHTYRNEKWESGKIGVGLLFSFDRAARKHPKGAFLLGMLIGASIANHFGKLI